MRPRRLILPLLLSSALASLASDAPAHWSRFRGSNGLGIAPTGSPPVHFGPATNVVWKTALPPGHSSPCIWGNRIFLTGLENGKLLSICLDRRNGQRLWHREVPAEKIEATHQIANPACPTPTADAERVYTYFGSFGLLCYDHEGNEQWYRQLPPPIVEFGTGTSPILTGELLLLVCDQDMDSYLLAVDRRTGKTVWKTDRSEFHRNFATPFVWRHDGIEELAVSGGLFLVSYDPKTGRERWRVGGLSRIVNASPVAGEGLLFVSSWNLGSGPTDRVHMPPFEEAVRELDKNGDGGLTITEIPTGPIKQRFSIMDFNKDGKVTAAEWNTMAHMFAKAENSVFAVRPGGQGDITATHVVWKSTRSLPYISSPLYYQGRLYTVKSGGLASCYEAKTGKVLYQDERLGAMGDYYASAVAADNRVYFVSQLGEVVVVQAGDTLNILARNKLDAQVFATPAIVGNVLYVRTTKHLYAFGK